MLAPTCTHIRWRALGLRIGLIVLVIAIACALTWASDLAV